MTILKFQHDKVTQKEKLLKTDSFNKLKGKVTEFGS